ncbi:I78 family peptidase inhibitor [Gemmobacter serpentinus]|uniref:I78 family peptidase inhibitor n=1 Tax=Gemmobacter serpentinus TaxID=2652247 RepID=UPI00124D0824|nr:I78 family peptidase inhibitor [Gemmobacter serpentinus]
MTGVRSAAALMLLGALAGCVPAGGGAPVNPPSGPAPVAPAGGSCGAEGLQGLVGKSRASISGQRFAHELRVYEEGQPITMDYNADRLNIEVSRSGTILRVSCG